jgi:hypothetical protein
MQFTPPVSIYKVTFRSEASHSLFSGLIDQVESDEFLLRCCSVAIGGALRSVHLEADGRHLS